MKRLLALAVALCAGAAPMPALAQVERPSYEKPLSSEAVHDVQARLHALGYYGGPIDGAWGRGTEASLERFQRDRRLPVTGVPSRETMVALGLNPDSYLSGNSAPRSESERLNRREVERIERGQY